MGGVLRVAVRTCGPVKGVRAAPNFVQQDVPDVSAALMVEEGEPHPIRFLFWRSGVLAVHLSLVSDAEGWGG